MFGVDLSPPSPKARPIKKTIVRHTTGLIDILDDRGFYDSVVN
jgi:hypothetical protein